MAVETINAEDLLPEISFQTSRSSGPGGQNVNKVNSRVTLKIDIRNSTLLSEEQRSIILRRIESKLTKEGVLLISAQEARSQTDNKALTLQKLDALLRIALTPVKKRRPTKPGKAAREKRLHSKKRNAERKQSRKRPD